jgi:hypothetical protein
VFVKSKYNKTITGFSKTQQFFILFYNNSDMFRSLDCHQPIFTKLRIRYMQCLTTHRKKTNIYCLGTHKLRFTPM